MTCDVMPEIEFVTSCMPNGSKHNGEIVMVRMFLQVSCLHLANRRKTKRNVEFGRVRQYETGKEGLRKIATDILL